MTDLFAHAEARELARRSDPPTSKAAAEQIVHDIPRIREAVERSIKSFGKVGCTDQMLEECLRKLSPSSVRTRRAELVRDGVVRDSGLTARTSSNREAIIWVHREFYVEPRK